MDLNIAKIFAEDSEWREVSDEENINGVDKAFIISNYTTYGLYRHTFNADTKVIWNLSVNNTNPSLVRLALIEVSEKARQKRLVILFIWDKDVVRLKEEDCSTGPKRKLILTKEDLRISTDVCRIASAFNVKITDIIPSDTII